MSNEQKHIKLQPDFDKKTREIISGTFIAWDKSREQVWLDMEKKLDLAQPPVNRVIIGPWMKFALAASITLLVGLSLLFQFYSKTIRVPAGQHSSIYLPDHSRVRLNAQSVLSYKPLLWRFSRMVRFEGEAFFDVEKGKTFEVSSGNGKTIVMGTSFNVYARSDEYQVTCISGKVNVMENKNNKAVILSSGQKAAISTEGILEVQYEINEEQTLSWLSNKISFTSASLRKVFEEISRQYGVLINIPGDIDNTYTGSFKKNTSVEHALNMVCKPFNLKFTRKSNDEYVISRNN